jgi:hypothetical protein
MSMHMLPAYFSTTSTKKRKQKKSKKQQQTDAAHAKFLKKMGYNGPVVQRSEPAAHNGVVAGSNPAGPTTLSNQIPTGVAPKKEPMQYSGKRKLLGIATMHKSNMVPVFSTEDAEALAKMRR